MNLTCWLVAMGILAELILFLVSQIGLRFNFDQNS
jgi:hypothetical protein